MIRRACAIVLLLALSGQLTASLYACHHHTGVHGESGGDAAAGSVAAIQGQQGGAHDHADSGPLRGCNRHHRGPCAHEGRGALNACSGDPAAGLQLASEGTPETAPSVIFEPSLAVALGVVPAPVPAGRQPAPELPPPRA